MKAKEAYKILQSCKTEDEVVSKVTDILEGFINDVKTLKEKRNIRSMTSLNSVVREVNQKWLAIVRIHEKERMNLDNANLPISAYELMPEGFEAVCAEAFGYNFDLTSYKQKLAELKKRQEEQANALKNFTPYKVTPYEDLNMDNINHEILSLLYALGQYSSIGISPNILKPLANRIAILRYWSKNGKIDLADVDNMNADPDKWIAEHTV